MLFLDSEAISALASGPPARRDRVRALIVLAQARGDEIGTIAAVLAEVIRGRPADAGVFSALRRNRLKVRPVDQSMAVRAGRLLGGVGAGSEMAVDAFLVAAADLDGAGVIATVDLSDLRLPASRTSSVTVAGLDG